MIWRVAASTRLHDDYNTIATHWSLDDLVDAHDVLNLYEDLDFKASKQTR